MWKPAERFRHALPEPGWPTVEEAARSSLFQPIRVGATVLRERTWVPAMVPWRATEDGFVTPEVLEWYGRFARGQPGALVVEATGIRDIPSGPLLRVGDDRFLPGLERLVETVARESAGRTRLFLQVIDFLAIRRRPTPERFFERYLQVTERHREALAAGGRSEEEVRAMLLALGESDLERVLAPRELEALRFGYRERVTDTHLPHVRDLPGVLPDLFAAAAERARRAGFDGVELHYAHAYTMASFLSPRNDRDDGYGGSRQSRVRLPLEVLAAVRARVGGGFVTGCRLLSEECIEDGGTLDDASYYAVALAKSGVDYVSLSRGGKFEDAKQPRVGWAAYPYTGRSGFECMPTALGDARGPFGRGVAGAAAVRRALREAGCQTPVVVAGGLSTFRQAEEILSDGEADIIAAARQSLADPDWFKKMRMGRGAEVRRCIYSNVCEGLDQMHKQVTCQLWDRVGLDDAGVRRTNDGRRRLTAPEWTA